MAGIRGGSDYTLEHFSQRARILNPTHVLQLCGTGGLPTMYALRTGEERITVARRGIMWGGGWDMVREVE